MKPNILKFAPALLLGMLVGFAGGAFLSDAATLGGFPHHKYVVTLKHTDSPVSDYLCTKRASGAGLNLSAIDSDSGRQKDCVIYVTGERNLDDSFDIYYGADTWWGRWQGRDKPLHIHTKDILSVKGL